MNKIVCAATRAIASAIALIRVAPIHFMIPKKTMLKLATQTDRRGSKASTDSQCAHCGTGTRCAVPVLGSASISGRRAQRAAHRATVPVLRCGATVPVLRCGATVRCYSAVHSVLRGMLAVWSAGPHRPRGNANTERERTRARTTAHRGTRTQRVRANTPACARRSLRRTARSRVSTAPEGTV